MLAGHGYEAVDLGIAVNLDAIIAVCNINGGYMLQGKCKIEDAILPDKSFLFMLVVGNIDGIGPALQGRSKMKYPCILPKERHAKE